LNFFAGLKFRFVGLPELTLNRFVLFAPFSLAVHVAHVEPRRARPAAG
jgi:hypothetical protein